MKKVKITSVKDDTVTFSNGSKLYSTHEQDCCESHYLSTSDIVKSDFEELEFDISNADFVRKVEGYGIELIPIKGHPIRIPGYGYNNGYYSSNLTLELDSKDSDISLSMDISECQTINE